MAKAKKAGNGTTLVTFLLDKSGSMESIKTDTMAAFNAYVGELKKDGKGILFSFLQFDTNSIDKICANAPIASAPALSDHNYQPNGGTPLIDAAFKTIKAVETAVQVRDDNPKVVICIQTDGQENASVEYSWDDLTALVKEKTALGWQFNFMGAGIDAYQQAGRMGIHAMSTMSYDHLSAEKTSAAFAASARNTAMYARGLSANTAYSGEQKQLAGDAFSPDLTATSPWNGSNVTGPTAGTVSTPHVKPKGGAGRKPIVEDITL